MRTVFESNELKPMVTTSFVDDPIAFWKKASADGTGRDVLAAMLNVLSTGYVRVGQGKDEIFVWPYFAETDLAELTPAQEVELYRIVPPQLALPMKTIGQIQLLPARRLADRGVAIFPAVGPDAGSHRRLGNASPKRTGSPAPS